MEDVPLLAQYFIKMHSTRIGKTFDAVDKMEIDKLLAYDWPGNVRELENVIERATILNREPRFTMPELGKRDLVSLFSNRLATLKELERQHRELEKQHILKVLHASKWKIRGRNGAARTLDVKPTTLEYKIKKFGIKRPVTS
jgi:transcriptional regulator with GAF, ATPase, and Fis domain